MNKLSHLAVLTIVLAGPTLAQTNVQSTAATKSELKQESKANKAQAKAGREAAKTALAPQ